jgi:hypothetical protein
MAWHRTHAKINSLTIQRAEPAVTMRPERAHAQCVGQRERLVVVRCDLIHLKWRATHRALAEEPQDVDFVAPL